MSLFLRRLSFTVNASARRVLLFPGLERSFVSTTRVNLIRHSPLLAETAESHNDWYQDFDKDVVYDKKRKSFDRQSVVKSNVDCDDDGTNVINHDYQRDFDADQSSVDLEQVNRLIAERMKARISQNYDKADTIRDELFHEHGVRINDNERIWQSGCHNDVTTGQSRRSSSAARGGRDRARGLPSKQARSIIGPHGHDYELSADAGPNKSGISEEQIHQRIAERMHCKMRRDFDEADEIQAELIQNGIFIHDRLKEWRADGRRFANLGNRPVEGDQQQYTQSDRSESTTRVEEIQAMVDERGRAKRNRNFDLADGIRQELQDVYNVQINDKTRQWSVGRMP